MSKNITTQAEILIVHRMLGPQDVAAVREWIKYHGERDDILGELATLKTGECFVWAPDFPEGKPIGLKRVQILDRETFDSSATPKVGQRAAEPKALAPVDLEKLRSRMAATIEKAKAEDPRELRRRIAELQKQVAEGQRRVVAPSKPAREKRVEVPALKDGQVKRLEQAGAALRKSAATVEQAIAGYHVAADQAFAIADAMQVGIRKALVPAPSVLEHVHGLGPRRLAAIPTTSGVTITKAKIAGPPAEGITAVAQRILNALAELEQLGAREPSRELVAFLAGYSNLTSKGFANAIGTLRTEARIDYPSGGTVRLTPTGRGLAQSPDMPRTPAELQERIILLLGGASGKILAPLIAVYPRSLPRDEVAAKAGYGNLTSKGFANAIGRLRTLGFIDYPDRGSIVACPVLFLEGA